LAVQPRVAIAESPRCDLTDSRVAQNRRQEVVILCSHEKVSQRRISRKLPVVHIEFRDLNLQAKGLHLLQKANQLVIASIVLPGLEMGLKPDAMQWHVTAPQIAQQSQKRPPLYRRRRSLGFEAVVVDQQSCPWIGLMGPLQSQVDVCGPQGPPPAMAA